MNEHVMLEIARQRTAERQESARLVRLAREQRAADRAGDGQCRRDDHGERDCENYQRVLRGRLIDDGGKQVAARESEPLWVNADRRAASSH